MAGGYDVVSNRLILFPVYVRSFSTLFSLSGAGTEAVSSSLYFPPLHLVMLIILRKLAATLSFFILAMVLYPRIQHKLRDEIDAVVGAPSGEFDNTKANFPTFQDTKNMPYLHAVIKEVMRCSF